MKPKVLVTREVFTETLDYLARYFEVDWTPIRATVRCTHRRGGSPCAPTP